MYRIDEDRKQEYRLILPATLDAHFPLLKYMFWTRKYRVEILDNTEGIVDTGLKYANNEMCYPFILMVGQVISDIRSSGYPAEKTRVLMPTAGDACRGACFIGLMQNALNKAHLEEAKVLNNLAGLHVEMGQSVEAEHEYAEAVSICRRMVDICPEKHESYLAGTLNNVANLHFDTGRLAEAEREYGESFKIYRHLAEVCPEKFEPVLAVVQTNIAALNGNASQKAVQGQADHAPRSRSSYIIWRQ